MSQAVQAPPASDAVEVANRPDWSSLVAVALTGLSLLLWWVGATTLDIAKITDVGILPALNVPLIAASVLLLFTFVWSLRRSHGNSVLALETIAFALILFATGPIIEPIVGFHVSWRHAGVIDHIVRGYGIDPTIDVYFNWPGFFVLAAILSDLSNVDNPIELARWAPVIYNLAYLVPMYFLGKHLGLTRNHIWLGLWIFFLGNWIGQDYFSPQGLAYLGYLAILAIVARHLVVDVDAVDKPVNRGAGAMLAVATIVVIYVLMVPTHQLTPILTLITISAMAVWRVGVPGALPIFMLVALTAWWVFMASEFLRGNLPEMVEQIGRIDALLGANVSERLGGSPGHQLVVRARVLSTLAMWAAAFIGWRRVKDQAGSGPSFRFWTIAFFAPFALLPLASYGGEMVLRVFLYTLPAVAFLSVQAIAWMYRKGHDAFLAAAAAALLLLLVVFPLTRYGNESTNLFTPAEQELVDVAYDLAPDGSLIIAGVDNLPWKYREYDVHKHLPLERIDPLPEESELVAIVADLAGELPPGHTYVIFNRVQHHHLEVFGVWPIGTFERMADRLVSSGTMEVAFENEDGVVLRSAS